MACINIQSKQFKDLVEATKLPSFLLEAKVAKFQRDNVTDEFPTAEQVLTEGEVNQSLKAVEILNSDKAIQIFEKGKKANWDLNKILTELQVPKDQKQLILDSNISDRNDIITSLLANYSYTVEINTSKKIKERERFGPDGQEFTEYFSESTGKTYNYNEYLGWMSEGQEAELPEDAKLIEILTNENSSYYSSLTVPGGTNYTENEIATPGITPSIKGHAQFATDNGIGWFRSDEKAANIKDTEALEQELQNAWDNGDLEYGTRPTGGSFIEKANSIEGTKTRRILEVQSDLFQKGRDLGVLTGLDKDYRKDDIFEESGFRYKRIRVPESGDVYQKIDINKYKENPFSRWEIISKEEYEKPNKDSNENKFLQLLNKDNNWVTFFVKSIIQDSSKKGYEKVLFPAGDTAAKIEGHETVQSFIDNKENRIKNITSEAEVIENGEYRVKNTEIGEAYLIVTDKSINLVSVEDYISDWKYGLSIGRKTAGRMLLDNNYNENLKLSDVQKAEIQQIEKEIEDAKAGKLKISSIASFYETTIQNILNKQYGKNLINRITDEYGNDWFELVLSESRDSQTIFNELISENAEPLFGVNSNSNSNVFNEINEDTFYGNLGFTDSLSASMVLSNIIEYHKDNVSQDMSFFLNKAQALLNKTKAKVILISQNEMNKVNPNALMYYDNSNNTITLSKESFKTNSPNRMIKSFIHEVVHATTVNAYRNANTFEEKEFVKLIDDAFHKYYSLSLNDKLEEDFSYGFTDAYEFIAEIYSNPEFQNELLNLDKKNNTNFFTKLVDAIRRLFGLSKTQRFDSLISASILINEVSKMAETDRSNFKGSQYESGYDFGLNFELQDTVREPKFTKLEDRLDHLVNTAKDAIDQVYARTKKNRKVKSEEAQKEYLKNITSLIDEMASYNDLENWKVVLAYTKSFSKTVYSLRGSLDKKDLSLPGLIDMIYRYEDYLSSYDLLPEIKALLSTARLQSKDLTEDNLKDIEAIQDTITSFESKHSQIISDFEAAKVNQSIALLSDPRYNTKVEVDFRKRLEQEYKDKGITGESRTQYVSRILNTRDAEAFKQALEKSANELANDPTFDISSMAKTLFDPLNTNSRLIEVVVNIVNSVRDKIITQFNNKNLELGEMFKTFISKVGNKKPSELYKNMYEVDKDGNFFLKGEYIIKFKDKFYTEYTPILKELSDLAQKYEDEGIKKNEYKKKDDYKALLTKKREWLKENTKSNPNSALGLDWLPKDIYRNPKLSEAEQIVLNEFRKITNDSNKLTGGRATLVRKLKNNGDGISYYKLPSISKSDFERQIELDTKGLLKDKWTDLTTIKTDDIGFAKEAVNNKGEELKSVRVHFRGKLDPKQQSLDLFTMYRMEYLNSINYSEKTKEESNLLLLADIAKNKKYKKTSKKTGKTLTNMFSSREPVVLFEGTFSNEFERIKGLIDSNVYDILSEHAGTIMGMDVNKVMQTVNGVTASIAMSLNIASGTANIFNGMTQLFIESMGDQFISKKSLYKAEKAYTLDLPKVLADLGNPTKTSRTNQILNMFDTFGGFSPEQQSYLKNTVLKKLVSKESMNGFNEMGEHMMNSVLTMAVLDNLKVMNKQYKFIDTNGNIVEESKAASLLDMLKTNEKGEVYMDSNVAYTNHNLGVNYFEGGKTHINLLIKKKTHDLFGVYDTNMQNELYKTFYGKALMMFKRFLISGLQARYKGISTANKAKDELDETDVVYNSALKEYEEGTYTTLIRFFTQGVKPMLKSLSLAHMSEYYNQMSDYEKGNLRKVTTEIVFTMVMLPIIGMLLGAAGDGDDDELSFWIYQFRRLDSELSQFRDPREAARLISNPVAGTRLIQNALGFISEVVTPLNFIPEDDENFFSYLDVDSKGNNVFVKKGKKLVPIWSQLDKNYVQMHNFIANPSK